MLDFPFGDICLNVYSFRVAFAWDWVGGGGDRGQKEECFVVWHLLRRAGEPGRGTENPGVQSPLVGGRERKKDKGP